MENVSQRYMFQEIETKVQIVILRINTNYWVEILIK